MAALASANTCSQKSWHHCEMCEKFMQQSTSTKWTVVSNNFQCECFFVAKADLTSIEPNDLNLRVQYK